MRFLLALVLLASAANASPPQVVTDIAPTHSLVASVMKGIAEPALLLSQSSDPHHAALRPSQAYDLQNADIIIAIGGGLTPWLKRSRQALAPDAIYLDLMSAGTTLRLKARISANFGEHDSHKHSHTHAGEDGTDPHGWLDTQNAINWLSEIAQVLGEHDPENAAQYRANADMATANLEQLQVDIQAELAPHAAKPVALFHDAFHYFESRFNLNALAAVTLSDASDPGVAWMRDLRNLLAQNSVKCLFSNAGMNSRRLEILAEGQDLRIVALDHLGQRIAPGPELYVQMLRALSADLRSCLDG